MNNGTLNEDGNLHNMYHRTMICLKNDHKFCMANAGIINTVSAALNGSDTSAKNICQPCYEEASE
jgi:hypothetical protein